MDELILAVAKALGKGMTVSKIHDAILAKGWSEDNCFLAIKAGEQLAQAIKKADAEKKPPSFRRVP